MTSPQRKVNWPVVIVAFCASFWLGSQFARPYQSKRHACIEDCERAGYVPGAAFLGAFDRCWCAAAWASPTAGGELSGNP